MAKHADGAPTARAFPLTKAEFARRSGRTKQSISDAIKGPLAPALLSNGRIDANSASARAWYSKRRIDPEIMLASVPRATSAVARNTTPDANEGDEHQDRAALVDAALADLADVPADKLPDMTLRDITQRFGTMQGFQDFLDARKTAADIGTKELKNKVLEGLYIEREFVRVHVFGLLDATNNRLLTDMPRTASSAVMAIARTNGTEHDVETALRERISDSLEFAKARIIRTLQRRKTTDESEFEDPGELRGSKEDYDAAPVRGARGSDDWPRGAGSNRRPRRDARRPAS